MSDENRNYIDRGLFYRFSPIKIEEWFLIYSIYLFSVLCVWFVYCLLFKLSDSAIEENGLTISPVVLMFFSLARIDYIKIFVFVLYLLSVVFGVLIVKFVVNKGYLLWLSKTSYKILLIILNFMIAAIGSFDLVINNFENKAEKYLLIDSMDLYRKSDSYQKLIDYLKSTYGENHMNIGKSASELIGPDNYLIFLKNNTDGLNMLLIDKFKMLVGADSGNGLGFFDWWVIVVLPILVLFLLVIVIYEKWFLVDDSKRFSDPSDSEVMFQNDSSNRACYSILLSLLFLGSFCIIYKLFSQLGF